jgi:uncharacterized membrane protein YkvA (DUF1232 family)
VGAEVKIMEMNKSVYYAGFIGIVALALTYVFWGADVIPDALAAAGPGVVAAWLDDAVVIVAGIFALARWRQVAFGTKGKKGLGWKAGAVFIPIIIAGLAYVFWIVDLIPDTVPYIGWADDAVAIIMLVYVAGRIRKRLKA